MNKILVSLLLALLFQTVALAQVNNIDFTYDYSSHIITSDSVSILSIEDELIDKKIRILFYPSFKTLQTKLVQWDSQQEIDYVVLLLNIKKKGEIKFQDVAFPGNEKNNKIRKSLILNTDIMVIDKDYRLLADSLDISIKLKIDHNITKDTSLNDDSTIYYEVDRYPILITKDREYPYVEIKEFINHNLKYPDTDACCSGKVFITIIIEKDGTVSNKEFLRKLCPGFDENAMAVIDLMNKWKPGLIDNTPVRAKIVIPISWIIY